MPVFFSLLTCWLGFASVKSYSKLQRQLQIHRCPSVKEIQYSYVVNHIVREPELFSDESEPELLRRQALSIPTVQHSGCRRFHHHPFPCFGSRSGFEGATAFWAAASQPCEEPGKKEETKLASRATGNSSIKRRKGPTWGTRMPARPARTTAVQQLRPGRSHEDSFRNSFCYSKGRVCKRTELQKYRDVLVASTRTGKGEG